MSTTKGVASTVLAVAHARGYVGYDERVVGGGSFGFADPGVGIGFAYALNRAGSCGMACRRRSDLASLDQSPTPELMRRRRDAAAWRLHIDAP
jgi:hypothetical protein